MTHSCSHRGITLLAILFTFGMIQRIEGYPHPWKFFLSYAVKQPSSNDPSHEIGVNSGLVDVLRETSTTTPDITASHDWKPLMANVGGRDESRILKVSKQKRNIRLEGTSTDEDPDKAKHAEDGIVDKDKYNEDEEIEKEIYEEDEGLDKAKADEDENIDEKDVELCKEKADDDENIDEEDVELDTKKDGTNEELDTEVNDNNENNRKIVESNVNMDDVNRTKDNDILIGEALKNKELITPKGFVSATQNGAITGPGDIDNDGLIFEAMMNNIFLTPEEFELSKKNEEDKDASQDIKKYENRAIRNSNAVPRPTNLSTTDGRIVFPDVAATMNLDDFARLPVPSCNGSTYCEHLPYYPSDELVENALRINYIEPLSDPSTITQRMGPLEPDGTREESLCFSETKEIKPGSGLDENQEWQYIINNSKYEQKIEIELCLDEGESCRLIDPPASGYKTFCKQKYAYRHLVTITPNGTTASKSIRMPSSCCCHVKFSPNIASRMGGDLQMNSQQGPKLNL